MRQVNPAMFDLINSHQQEFIWLLNQPVINPNTNNQMHMQQQQERPVLTEEDETNITQLTGITGFDRSKCYKG